MPFIIFNALVPVFLPYRRRESSASRYWIRIYVAIFVAICIFLLTWMLTQNPVAQLCHNISAMVLTENLHYTIAYADNRNVGEATVTVTGGDIPLNNDEESQDEAESRQLNGLW